MSRRWWQKHSTKRQMAVPLSKAIFAPKMVNKLVVAKEKHETPVLSAAFPTSKQISGDISMRSSAVVVHNSFEENEQR